MNEILFSSPQLLHTPSGRHSRQMKFPVLLNLPHSRLKVGAYKNLKYKLIDQNGENLELGSSAGIDEVTEVFSNYSGTSGLPPSTANTTPTNDVGEFGDTEKVEAWRKFATNTEYIRRNIITGAISF